MHAEIYKKDSVLSYESGASEQPDLIPALDFILLTRPISKSSTPQEKKYEKKVNKSLVYICKCKCNHSFCTTCTEWLYAPLHLLCFCSLYLDQGISTGNSTVYCGIQD